MSSWSGRSGVYAFRIESDQQGCEVILYREDLVVNSTYLQGADAYPLALGVGRRWLESSEAFAYVRFRTGTDAVAGEHHELF